MKRFYALLLFLVSLYFAPLSGAPKQDLIFSIDDYWHMDYECYDGPYGISEMTIEGETVHGWSELVTVQKNPRFNAPLEKFYSLMISGLQSTCPDYPVLHRLIFEDENSIFFEWWIDEPYYDAQHEWCRVILSDVDCFIIRYTTKKLDKVEDIRPIWEKRLMEAHFGDVNELQK